MHTLGGMAKGPSLVAGALRSVVRRRPTLPPRLQGSTIGAERLSFRVRNGTGRFPLAMTAGTLLRYGVVSRPYLGNRTVDAANVVCGSSPRPISTGQLHLFPGFHI